MIAIFGSTFPTSCGTARPVSSDLASDCGGEIRVAQALDTEVTSHISEADSYQWLLQPTVCSFCILWYTGGWQTIRWRIRALRR